MPLSFGLKEAMPGISEQINRSVDPAVRELRGNVAHWFNEIVTTIQDINSICSDEAKKTLTGGAKAVIHKQKDPDTKLVVDTFIVIEPAGPTRNGKMIQRDGSIAEIAFGDREFVREITGHEYLGLMDSFLNGLVKGIDTTAKERIRQVKAALEKERAEREKKAAKGKTEETQIEEE